MPIFISNSLYISPVDGDGGNVVRNRPLIGWSSYYSRASANSVDSEDGYNPTAVWSPDTYSKWRSSDNGAIDLAKTLNFELITVSPVDYVGIAGHDIGGRGIPYAIQSSPNNLDWTIVVNYKTVPTNAPIIEYFNPVTARYWRIIFAVPAFTAGVYVAHVKIGKILQLERPTWGGVVPGGMDIKTEKIGSKSYSGQHLGSVLISEGQAFSIEQKNNTAAFIRSEDMQRFFKHANQLQKLSDGPTETFFYAWRPTTHPTEVQYCGKTNNFSPPSNQQGTPSGGLMGWSMSGDAFL